MTEYLPGDIRQRIRDLLAERQMSVAELAERVGCDETTLGRFIRGDTKKSETRPSPALRGCSVSPRISCWA